MTADPLPTASISPDRVTPRTIGIMNVVYGLLLMGSGLCLGVYEMIPPLIGFAGEAASAQRVIAEKQQKERLAKIEEQLKGELPEGDRISLEEERKTAALPPARPMISTLIDNPKLRDPIYIGHFLMDLASGLFLNMFMFLSGVGLLLRKRWGRWLAIFVAWLKLIRLVALVLSAMLVLSPFLTGMVSELIEQAAASGNEIGMTGAEAARAIRTAILGYYGSLFLFGSIFPIVTIRLLGRKSVRAAFQKPTRIESSALNRG